MSKIALHRPFISDREQSYVREAIALGQVGRDGRFTQRCSALLEDRFDAPRVLMTSSCTAALEIAGTLCGLRAGDEVVVPSYTYVSTASAICRVGARPVFVDIRHDTLNLDESLLEEVITCRTRAIFPVHYAGVGCEMDAIKEIAARHDLFVVEDAAQGVNASYKNRPLGTLGHLGAYSFHETKNYMCGEGGALVVNSAELLERAEILRDNGTNRAQFFRGQVEQYTWVDLGSSYALNEIASAVLFGQLEQLDNALRRRSCVFKMYMDGLTKLEQRGDVRLPVIPSHCQTNYHLFHILVNDEHTRNNLIEHFRHDGIQSAFHFVPLHSSPVGQRLGITPRPLPVTEHVSRCIVRLPIYPDLSETDQARVIDSIDNFFTKNRSRHPKCRQPNCSSAAQTAHTGSVRGEEAAMDVPSKGDDRAKLKLPDIFQYWAAQAAQHGQSYEASWSDLPAIELELKALLDFVEEGDRILDVGCANGYTTLAMAASKRVEIRGLDYVPEMIAQAKLRLAEIRREISGRVSFEVGDITKLDEPADFYDKVIVVRVCINLGHWERQVQALTQVARVVRPGGLLLISEATIQGWRQLNSFRQEWNLPDIEVPKFNLYLDEERTTAALTGELDLVEIRNFASSYFVGTRVFKPLMARLIGSESSVADPLMHWNRWFAALPAAGDYGTQKLFVFRKR